MSDDELFDECPLCAEEVDISDLNFKPCTCGYQICTFCFEKICSGDNRCPACRRGYPEERLTYAPATPKQIAKYKALKQIKDGFVPTPDLGDRKHLANTRIEQKNLVYVLGFPMKYNDPDLLRHNDYFGQFGSITKLQISPRARSIGQPASFAVHVTYAHPDEAKKAIAALEGLEIDGRAIKATYGMNKYCANFLKFLPCHSPNCLFLHEEVKESDDSHSSYSGQTRKINPKSTNGPPLLSKRSDSRGFGRLKDLKDSKGSALPATASWAKAPSSNSDLTDGNRNAISDFPTLSSHIESALRSPTRGNQRRGRAPYSAKGTPDSQHSIASHKRESSPALAQDPFEDLSTHNIPPEASSPNHADSDQLDPLSGSDLLYSSGDEQASSTEDHPNDIAVDKPNISVHDKDSNIESGSSNHSSKSPPNLIASDASDFILTSDSALNQFNDSTLVQNTENFIVKDSSLDLETSGIDSNATLNNLCIFENSRLAANSNSEIRNKFNTGNGLNHFDSTNLSNPGYPENFLSSSGNVQNLYGESKLPFPQMFNDSPMSINKNTPFNRLDTNSSPRVSSLKSAPQKNTSTGSRFQFAQLPSQQSPHIPPVQSTRAEMPEYMILSNVSNVPTRINGGVSGVNYPPGIMPPWTAEDYAQNVVASSPELETRTSKSSLENIQLNSFDSFNSNSGGIEVQLKDLFLADLQKRGKSTLPPGYSNNDSITPNSNLNQDFLKHASVGFSPSLSHPLEHPHMQARQTRLPSLENLTKFNPPPMNSFSNTPTPFIHGLQSDTQIPFNSHMRPPALNNDISHNIPRQRQPSINNAPKQLPPRQKEGSRFFNRSSHHSGAASDVTSPVNSHFSVNTELPHLTNPIGSNSTPNELRDLFNMQHHASRPYLPSHRENSSDSTSTAINSQTPFSVAAGVKQGSFMNTPVSQPGGHLNFSSIPQTSLQSLASNETQQSLFRPNNQSLPPALSNNTFGSFPLGSQGMYHMNSQTPYSGFSQGQGSFNGSFQGPPPTSFLESSQLNLGNSGGGPYFNNRNFSSTTGSLQGDLRNNTGYFPPSLGVSGISSPFPGRLQDSPSRWQGLLANQNNISNSQNASVTSELCQTPMRPFSVSPFMAPSGHILPPIRPIATTHDNFDSYSQTLSESEIAKSLESPQRENVKVVAKLDAVLNDAPSSQPENKIVSKYEVNIDPVTPLTVAKQDNGPLSQGSPTTLLSKVKLDDKSSSKSDNSSSINKLSIPEPNLVSNSKPPSTTESKSNKVSKNSKKAENDLGSKLAVPDVIFEVVPPPPSKNHVEVESASAEISEVPSPSHEPATPMPVFALDDVNIPKILPKQLHNKIPDNYSDLIYQELRSTNLNMQKSLLESSLKKNKKAKKACKALALTANQDNFEKYTKINVSSRTLDVHIENEPAVLANKAFSSELRQTKQELAELAKIVQTVTSNLNYKFDIDFKL